MKFLCVNLSNIVEGLYVENHKTYSEKYKKT